MKKIIEYLEAHPVRHLATIWLDLKPKCRPFMFATDYQGELWFYTASWKDVSKELKTNPSLETSVSALDFPSLE